MREEGGTLYKLGDVVWVREDLVYDELYGRVRYVRGMGKHIGSPMLIIGAYQSDVDLEGRYLIVPATTGQSEFGRYIWTDEMFAPPERHVFKDKKEEALYVVRHRKNWKVMKDE